MIRSRYFLLGLLLTVAAWIASALLYQGLPDQVPTHWNIRGQVDAYGAKEWAAFLGPAIMTFTLLLFLGLPWLSPRRFEVTAFPYTYNYIMFLLLALFAYFHGIMLYAAGGRPPDVGKVLVAGIFLFLALFGNVLGKVGRNFWIGVRTPWTLADERVWRDTHRLAAPLYFALGALGFIAVLAGAPLSWCFAVLIVGATAPVPYSLLRYKQLQGTSDPRRTRMLLLVFGIGTVLLAAAVVWLVSVTTPHSIRPPADLTEVARSLIANLDHQRPEQAAERFDQTMKTALPPTALENAWQGLIAQKGALEGELAVRAERLGRHRAVYVTCQFEREKADVKVVFNDKGQISGLWFIPPSG